MERYTTTKKNMSESNMPAAEAVMGTEQELATYELAFHILPTVAEGEVTTVFDQIKSFIIDASGEVVNEETPARFDLAYEIPKYLEGRNRNFTSAYFGWVRFTVSPDKIAQITESVEGTKELLRHLLIRLSKVENQNPFFFHEAIATRVIETITIDAEDAAVVLSEDALEKGEDGEEKEVAV